MIVFIDARISHYNKTDPSHPQYDKNAYGFFSGHSGTVMKWFRHGHGGADQCSDMPGKGKILRCKSTGMLRIKNAAILICRRLMGNAVSHAKQ